MKRLILASVPADTPLPKALKSIHSGTRALVVDRPDGAQVVTAGDIMAACNDALDAGRDPKSVKVGTVIASYIATKAKPLPLPRNFHMGRNLTAKYRFTDLTEKERVHFRPAFEGDDHGYAIQHLNNDLAVVVTAHETFALDLGSRFKICTCAGDPKHTFEPRQLRDLRKCNKPHRAPVTCKPADGTS